MKKISLFLLAAILLPSLCFGAGASIGAINPAMLKRDAVGRVDTVASMRLVSGLADGQLVQLGGYYAKGDGGAGPVRIWNAASTCIDNGGSCIDPSAPGAGRWVFALNGLVDIRWYGAKGDGVTDDLPAILSAYNDLSENGTLYGDAGDFFLSAPLELVEIPRYSTIKINGALVVNSDIQALIVRDSLEINLDIKEIKNNAGSTKEGVLVESIRVSNINIGIIDGFKNGFKAVGKWYSTGKQTHGFASNRVDIGNISADLLTGTAVIITVAQDDSAITTNYGYVNEIEWHLRFMEGFKHVEFIPTSPTSLMYNNERFGGHKFILPHFEVINGAGSVAMELNYNSDTVILFPRFEGGSNPDFWVKENANCVRTNIYTNDSPANDKLQLSGSHGLFVGHRKKTVGGESVSSLTIGRNSLATGIYDPYNVEISSALNADTLAGTFFFDPNIAGKRVFDVYAGGVKDLDGNEKVFGPLDPLGYQEFSGGALGAETVSSKISVLAIDTTTAPSFTSYVMPKNKEIEGNSVFLSVVGYTQTITVKRNNGTSDVAAGVINSVGTWQLIFHSGKWHAVKISDSIMSP